MSQLRLASSRPPPACGPVRHAESLGNESQRESVSVDESHEFDRRIRVWTWWSRSRPSEDSTQVEAIGDEKGIRSCQEEADSVGVRGLRPCSAKCAHDQRNGLCPG